MHQYLHNKHPDQYIKFAILLPDSQNIVIVKKKKFPHFNENLFRIFQNMKKITFSVNIANLARV